MNAYEIEVQREISLPDTLVVQLKAAVTVTLQHEGVSPPAGLTLVLTHDERLRGLNREYRDIDAPTDVLSFEAGETMPGMETMPRFMGDIVISQPYAARQAEARGHSLVAELQLLAIHGVLHLLGHDHVEPEEKQRMWQSQTSILAQLGLPASVLAGAEDA